MVLETERDIPANKAKVMNVTKTATKRLGNMLYKI